jgi:sugar/nucleoside kinase (ribokinase family)
LQGDSGDGHKKNSLDPNLRKELASDLTYFRTMRELMSMASIFLPSEEDAALLFSW